MPPWNPQSSLLRAALDSRQWLTFDGVMSGAETFLLTFDTPPSLIQSTFWLARYWLDIPALEAPAIRIYPQNGSCLLRLPVPVGLELEPFQIAAKLVAQRRSVSEPLWTVNLFYLA